MGGALIRIARELPEPRELRVGRRTLYITCDEELYWAFRRYAANFRSYAEALRDLLRRAGAIKETRTF